MTRGIISVTKTTMKMNLSLTNLTTLSLLAICYMNVYEVEAATPSNSDFAFTLPTVPSTDSQECKTISNQYTFFEKITSPNFSEYLLRCPEAAIHLKSLKLKDMLVNGAKFDKLLPELYKLTKVGSLQSDLSNEFVTCINAIRDNIQNLGGSVSLSSEEATLKGLAGCKEPSMKHQVEAMMSAIKTANKRQPTINAVELYRKISAFTSTQNVLKIMTENNNMRSKDNNVLAARANLIQFFSDAEKLEKQPGTISSDTFKNFKEILNKILKQTQQPPLASTPTPTPTVTPAEDSKTLLGSFKKLLKSLS